MHPESQRARLRDLAREAVAAGIAAADPEAAVVRALGEHPLPGRVVVLALGKAAVPMLRGALSVLGKRAKDGLAVTKDGHAGGLTRLGDVEVLEAAHPVPDARSANAGRRLLELARTRGRDDAALVLLSGGGSSLVATPPPGLCVEDLATTWRLLLASGARLHEQNVVRRQLGLLADGGLGRALGPALVLVLSDVLGPVADVASGPCLANGSTPSDALAVLERLGLAELVPPPVSAFLASAPARMRAPELGEHVVVGSCALSVAAAVAALRARGLEVETLGAELEGDVGGVAGAHLARLAGPAFRTRAFVGGGETTVVVRGSGNGGRNQHLAALVARGLDGAPREVVFAAVGTDGTDGPTEVAGGLVDSGTFARCRAAGADPEALLRDFDSHALLRAAGDLVVTGPTGTNVMDLHVGLIAGIA